MIKIINVWGVLTFLITFKWTWSSVLYKGSATTEHQASRVLINRLYLMISYSNDSLLKSNSIDDIKSSTSTKSNNYYPNNFVNDLITMWYKYKRCTDAAGSGDVKVCLRSIWNTISYQVVHNIGSLFIYSIALCEIAINAFLLTFSYF